MPEFLRRLFSSDGFMPHGHCYMWQPELIWLHVVSDGLTALAYTTIPFTLLHIVRRRRDVPFHWMFLCFGTFIIACGATHALEIWTLWTPVYWLSGAVKALTAAASVPTAFLLVRLVPQALAMPTPRQLMEAHDKLRQAHEVLETRVLERTAELTRKNEELEREIAARKHATETVRELREQSAADARFRALLEAAPDAMVIANEEGNIVLVNAQTEALFGYKREELLDRPVEMLVPERSRRRHVEHRTAYSAAPTARAMGTGKELRGLRKDGTEFPVEVSLSPLETQEGFLVSSAIRDITERTRVEASLKLANRELEAFSYSVAHDLRAPLRGMNGYAQVLLDDHADKLDAEGRACLHAILGGASRMGSLIDALLSLARLSRTELHVERVDFAALVRATASQLTTAEPERTVDVVVESPLWAQLDPHLARALAENLIGNAWKFTSKVQGARIEVGVTDTRNGQAFYVRDNGAGFDMAFADKLFTPFTRLHPASDFPGTGVGLATVQRVVQRHGGRIWAEGAEGTGATFYFTIASASSGGAANAA